MKIPPQFFTQLPAEDLQEIAFMCRTPLHPAVKLLERLSNRIKKKQVHYKGQDFIVLYNCRSKEVFILREDISAKYLKQYNYNNHTKKRLQERFNIEASDEDICQMASMCRTKYQHIKLETSFANRTKNLIHFKGTDIVTIYEDSSDSIVTAMPPEYLSKEEHDWLYCSKRVRYKQLLKHSQEPPSHAL